MPTSDLILSEANAESQGTAQEEASTSDDDAPEPVEKAPRLFSNYKRKRHQSDPVKTSVTNQFSRYLELCDDFDSAGSHASLAFWSTNRAVLSKLFSVAMRVLCVPASSSPVERVFSHGGIIMRPHRARLSDKMLSNLIFLKCNNLANQAK